MKKAYNFVDLTNQRFGRLIAIRYLGKSRWLCKCDCGKEIIAQRGSLRAGSKKSCGCLLKESSKKSIIQYNLNRRQWKDLPYDKTQFVLYNVWGKMMDRCYNKSSIRYKDWGGRGIKVCEEWHNFDSFYKWAINIGYDITQPWYNRTLDRIDNNGNYEPSNCRIVSMKVQNKNKRKYKKGDKYA